MPASRKQKLQDHLLGLLLENVPLKLLSLGFAVALWAWVQSEQVIQRNIRAPVKYTWPPADELIRADEVPSSLTVTLKGPQGLVRTLDAQKIRFNVDLADGVAGSNVVDFTTRPLEGLPSSVNVLQITPPEADIRLERPLTRAVPVKISKMGDLPEGWVLREESVSPEEVEVVGPHSRVRNLREIPTEVIDLSALTADETRPVSLVTGSSTLRVLTQEPVQVTLTIEPQVTPRTFNDVPVSIRGGGWVPSVTTVQVELRGPTAEIRQLDADDLNVLIRPPEGTDGDTFTARWRAGDPESTMQVHTGSSAFTVSAVEPSRIEIRRIEE